MDEHAFDRWTAAMAHRRGRPSRRRLLAGGLFGGLLAGGLGVEPGDASTSLRTSFRQDCDLGCADSTCGEVPAGCVLFPPDNIWNTPIADLPVDARSDDYVASIGPDTGLHADFGSGLYEGFPIGIPFVWVPPTSPRSRSPSRWPRRATQGRTPSRPTPPSKGGRVGPAIGT